MSRSIQCPNCDGYKVAIKTNDLFHIIMTVFTGGLWLIVYIMILLANRTAKIGQTYQCQICGYEWELTAEDFS